MFNKRLKVSTSVQLYTAFTLAEVLITLGIIGIVAALTIPTLVEKYQNDVMAKEFIKTYSELNRAFMQLTLDNGSPGSFAHLDFMESGGGENQQQVADAFKPYLNVAGEKPSGCNTYSIGNPIVGLHGQAGVQQMWSCRAQTILASGVGLNWWSNSNSCTQKNVPCLFMLVDVNATKGPNVWGRDIYKLYIYTDGFSPEGAKNHAWMWTDSGDGCKDPNSYGYYCGVNVLLENGMSY